MSDNAGWAAWRPNFDEALSAYMRLAISLSKCAGADRHAYCVGEDCDVSLEDLSFTPDDIAPGAGRQMEEELFAFVSSCLLWRPECFKDLTPLQVGQDFFLTRNGHGAGFRDRGLGETGRWLAGIARPYGDFFLTVGDDGLYCSS